MRGLSTRFPRARGQRTPRLRVALVVALAGAQAWLGIIAPSPIEAATRKPQKDTSKSRTAHQAPKAVRTAGHQKHLRQRRSASHRAPARVAANPHGADKLVIPQGDGSPVVALAAAFLGKPYRFGAESGAFDCSGFVRRVFARIGIDLPHSAREQFALGEHVGRSDLEPGDLVFFDTHRRSPTHVGIYVGEDKFVHAASHGGRVQVDSLTDSYYAHRYLGARRIEI